NSLRLAKITTGINGLLLGRFKNCYEMDENKKTLSLNEVINDYWSEAKIPVFYNVIHGHVKDSITIPFGVNCKINTSRGFIELTESAVV
ncbi:MAG: LD-carboxypeptidase, partial [Rhodothermaceae bacterium]